MRVLLKRLAGTCFALAPMLVPCQASSAEPSRPSNAEILFRLANPCPATGLPGLPGLPNGPCKGYAVDRVIPIVCGGAEEPGNMQWQTLAEAKEKDRWEKIGCRKGRKLVLPGPATSVTEAFATGELPSGVQAQSLPPGGSAQPAMPREDATPEGETAEEK